MAETPNVLGWRRSLVLAIRTLALAIIFSPAIAVPQAWTVSKFGSLDGEEWSFLVMLMAILPAAIVSGLFLVLARLLSRKWGRAVLIWLSVLGVHVIQVGVLARATFFE